MREKRLLLKLCFVDENAQSDEIVQLSKLCFDELWNSVEPFSTETQVGDPPIPDRLFAVDLICDNFHHLLHSSVIYTVTFLFLIATILENTFHIVEAFVYLVTVETKRLIVLLKQLLLEPDDPRRLYYSCSIRNSYVWCKLFNIDLILKIQLIPVKLDLVNQSFLLTLIAVEIVD